MFFQCCPPSVERYTPPSGGAAMEDFAYRPHAETYSRSGSFGSTVIPTGPSAPGGRGSRSHVSAPSRDRTTHPSPSVPNLPSCARRTVTTYSVPFLSIAIRHASGSASGSPLFFAAQLFPPSVLLKTPRPKPVTYSTRASLLLFGSSRM